MICVRLISYTRDASRVVAAAAKICYSPSSGAELFDGLDEDAVGAFLSRLRESGHLSPFEHASFTFAVDGLSRVASHQLVRHRVASFSQQSQRYVAQRESCVVAPPSVASNERAMEIFERASREARRAYEEMISLGVPKEDARFILPHGWETRLVVTMNARELLHFFSLRLCRRAQWEIRALARRMLALANGAAPELFERAGPPCAAFGACREIKSCGSPYTCMEEILDEDDR